MSQGNVSNANPGQPNAEGTRVEDEKFVPKKAYEEVAADMHKYKNRLKEEAAKAAELEALLKALEDEKMQEKQQWKELYEKLKQEKDVADKKAREDREAFLRSVKKSALKTELGGKIKDAYLSHADLSKIELNSDGSVNVETLHAVANQFRQEYPELIPSERKIEPTAPASPTATTVSDGTKPIEQMTFQEKAALLAQIKASRG